MFFFIGEIEKRLYFCIFIGFETHLNSWTANHGSTSSEDNNVRSIHRATGSPGSRAEFNFQLNDSKLLILHSTLKQNLSCPIYWILILVCKIWLAKSCLVYMKQNIKIMIFKWRLSTCRKTFHTFTLILDPIFSLTNGLSYLVCFLCETFS